MATATGFHGRRGVLARGAEKLPRADSVDCRLADRGQRKWGGLQPNASGTIQRIFDGGYLSLCAAASSDNEYPHTRGLGSAVEPLQRRGCGCLRPDPAGPPTPASGRRDGGWTIHQYAANACARAGQASHLAVAESASRPIRSVV